MIEGLLAVIDTVGKWLADLSDNLRKLRGQSKSEEATLLEVTKEEVKKGKI